MILLVTIPGPPVPWQRTQGSGNRRFTPPKMRAYKAHVARCFQYEMLRAGIREPWCGPVRIQASFYLPDRVHRDLDNLAKSIFDAANGIAWEDDSWIVSADIAKVLDKERPRAVIEVAFLEESNGWVSPGRASALKASNPSSRTRKSRTSPGPSARDLP